MALERPRLSDPLPAGEPIVDVRTGAPTPFFLRQWLAARNINVTIDGVEVSLDQLTSDVAALVARQIIAGAGLTGGGDLSADRTLNVGAGTGIAADADIVRITDTTVTPGTFGDATNVGQFTVDQQGRITAAANVPIIGGGGGVLVPPTGAQFPIWLNQQNAVQGDRAGWSFGLLSPSVGTRQNAFRLKTLPTPPKTYTTLIEYTQQDATVGDVSLAIVDSTTSRAHTLNLLWSTTTDTERLGIARWTSPSVFYTDDIVQSVNSTNKVWFRIIDDAVNFTFQYSSSGAVWVTLATIGRTAWLANPDRIGFGARSDTTATAQLSVRHYDEV